MNRVDCTITCLVLFALSCAGCRAVEDRFVYHPVKSEVEQLPPHVFAKDVYFVTAEDVKIHARWCEHPNGKGALLYCPGNAGNLEHRGKSVRELWENLEQSVLIFDYPGYGQSEGHPSEEGCYAAADAAYDWLVKTKRVPPSRIIIYGESLGGGVGVDLASRKPHRALVLARTFTSVPDVAQAHFSMLPVKSIMYNRFDSLKKIRQCKQPIFIAYGENDILIPKKHAMQLERRAGGVAQLHVLEGLGHNDPPGAGFYQALRKFLAKAP